MNENPTPPAPKYKKNLTEKIQLLKKRLIQCQKEKNDIINRTATELKSKEDKIAELRSELNEQKESPEQMEFVDELKEEKSALKEENKRLLRELERYKDQKKIGFNLPSGAEIRGDIDSNETIQVENNVKILGSLMSSKDIILGHENQVTGDVISEKGSVKIGNACEVKGSIGGNEVLLAEGTTVGNIRSYEMIHIGKNCKVSNVYALGDVELEEDVEIKGSLEYAGDFDVSKGVKITGSVIPCSKKELKEKISKSTEGTDFSPVIVKEEDKKQEVLKKKSKIIGSTKEKIDDLRGLIRSARDENVDISQERDLLGEGITLYKQGKYKDADQLLSNGHSKLEEKLTHLDKRPKDEKKKVIDDFTEVKGVGRSIAIKLYEGGFHSMEELRNASLEDLQQVEGIGEGFSKKIKENLS